MGSVGSGSGGVMFASALRMSVYLVAVEDGEKEGIILRLRPKAEEKEEKRNSNWRVVGEGRSPRRQQDVVFILPHKGRCVRQQERGRENKGERFRAYLNFYARRSRTYSLSANLSKSLSGAPPCALADSDR